MNCKELNIIPCNWFLLAIKHAHPNFMDMVEKLLMLL